MIEVAGLTKFYGDRRAVDDVTFSVGGGQVVGLLGLNGAGKTSILRMLAGDLEPSAGRMRLAGVDAAVDPLGWRAQVGFLPERVPIHPEMTVTEQLRWVAALRGVPARDVAPRVAAVIDHLDLGPYAAAPTAALSHGFRKRVGIGTAIVHRPRLVILDEPISGLDPVQIVEMRALVGDLAGDHTVLVSSHILAEISQTCDHLLVLRAGRVVASGAEATIRARAAQAHVAELTVRGAAAAATQALRAVDGVSEVTVVSDHGDRCELRVRAEADRRAALVAALVAADLGVLRVDRAAGALEAAFLELTGPARPQDPPPSAAAPS